MFSFSIFSSITTVLEFTIADSNISSAFGFSNGELSNESVATITSFWFVGTASLISVIISSFLIVSRVFLSFENQKVYKIVPTTTIDAATVYCFHFVFSFLRTWASSLFSTLFQTFSIPGKSGVSPFLEAFFILVYNLSSVFILFRFLKIVGIHQFF